MTTITAAIKNGHYTMACDTLSTAGDIQQSNQVNGSKIIEYNGTLLGICGYHAVHCALQYLFDHSKEANYQFDCLPNVYESFRRIHKKLKDEYYLQANADNEKPFENWFLDLLMVNQHGIFTVTNMRGVTQHEKFTAIGSGDMFAMGAMLERFDGSYDSRDIARCGVRAAKVFDIYTGGDIVAESKEICP